MDEREMFEAWADLDGLGIRRCTHLDDIYASPATRVAWRAWQVARRTTPEREAWQPIETAPKDGTQMLLSNGTDVEQGWWMHDEGGIIEHRDMDGRYTGQTESDGFIGWWDVSGCMQPEPTHWKPLPTAPTSDKGGA